MTGKPAASLILALMVFCPNRASAHHVKGGYIQYKYNGAGSTSGSSNYTVTITVFFSCTAQGPRESVYLGVFNASTDSLVASKRISTTTATTVTKQYYSPCMSNPPTICYEIYTYVYSLDLPNLTPEHFLLR